LVSLAVFSAFSFTSSGSNTNPAIPPANFACNPKSFPSAFPTWSTLVNKKVNGNAIILITACNNCLFLAAISSCDLATD
jgi:hypothetical protein